MSVIQCTRGPQPQHLQFRGGIGATHTLRRALLLRWQRLLAALGALSSFLAPACARLGAFAPLVTFLWKHSRGCHRAYLPNGSTQFTVYTSSFGTIAQSGFPQEKLATT